MLKNRQKENRIRHKLSTRRTRLKRNQNPGGHKEGRASFPIQSQYKDSKIHTPNPTLKKRKGGREEEEEDAREGSRSVLASMEKEKEREREERVRGYLTPTTLNPKD